MEDGTGRGGEKRERRADGGCSCRGEFTGQLPNDRGKRVPSSHRKAAKSQIGYVVCRYESEVSEIERVRKSTVPLDVRPGLSLWELGETRRNGSFEEWVPLFWRRGERGGGTRMSRAGEYVCV